MPNDVSVADINLLDGDGSVAGTWISVEEVGEASIDLLVSQLHSNFRGFPKRARALTLKPEWVSGKTVKRQNIRHTKSRT
ncbi:MAG: hypothetical protein AAF558_01835 [Verrucomicrobiota bacterium]